MKTLALLTIAALTFNSCSRAPSLSVQLEKPDGTVITQAAAPLSKGYQWEGDSDIPGGGFQYHRGRVTEITATGATFDLLLIYVPASSPVGQRPMFHQSITISGSTPTVVAPFNTLRFRAQLKP